MHLPTANEPQSLQLFGEGKHEWDTQFVEHIWKLLLLQLTAHPKAQTQKMPT
jgi:hypothetical protein